MPIVYDHVAALHEAKTKPLPRRQMRALQRDIARDTRAKPRHARVTTNAKKLRRIARREDG